MGFKETGVITPKELEEKNLLPPKERLMKGPVVIIECPEEIPCNICVDACPFKAISMDKIYDIPRVNWEKCTGCATCVPQCPGLAIFVVDLSRDDKALITLPYEFKPEPVKGAIVDLLDREGRVVGKGRIVKAYSYDKTWAVTVEIPRDKWLEVRGIWIPRK